MPGAGVGDTCPVSDDQSVVRGEARNAAGPGQRAGQIMHSEVTVLVPGREAGREIMYLDDVCELL